MAKKIQDLKFDDHNFNDHTEGKHLCKTMRGARSTGEMTVARYTGVFQNKEYQDAFYQLINAQKQ